MKKRGSGILLHISSLPGDYGIGDLGKGAYDFIDFLRDAGQKYWQILPLGLTDKGNSPYQSFSAFAGNHYFIDLEYLVDRGWISAKKLRKTKLQDKDNKVNYSLVGEKKETLLRESFDKAYEEIRGTLIDFLDENKEIYIPFALFMTLRQNHHGKSHTQWEEPYRRYPFQNMENFIENNKKEFFFWVFTQWIFDLQWDSLKLYANAQDIQIIGDMPIYVSANSVDVWANPELFQLDTQGEPIWISGTPPDAFSETGQLWENPIYHWENMAKDDYKWWIQRFKYSFKKVDVLRVDHFRGFESYWQVKNGDVDASGGEWVLGPGIDLFKAIHQELGDLDVIAEDLGLITKEVRELMAATGFPGMKVLQFAFDPEDESSYLPHNHIPHCVVYTGTHDNETLQGWIDNEDNKDQVTFAKKYLMLTKKEGMAWGIIRSAWGSVAQLAVAQMQDFLQFGDEARMNTPGTVDNNWEWRLKKGDLSKKLAKKIKNITSLYGR